MSTNKTTIWDAIISCAPGICALLLLLGLGGCWCLVDIGEAAKVRAHVEAKP